MDKVYTRRVSTWFECPVRKWDDEKQIHYCYLKGIPCNEPNKYFPDWCPLPDIGKTK